MSDRKSRESGIELLRILTMCGVILLHYNDGRAFKYVADNSIQQYVLFFLESVAICAVDLFVLISGYFLSGTQKRSLLKPLELIVQLILIHEGLYLLSVFFGSAVFSIKTVIVKAMPNNYFVILYCTLYIISPYINVVLKQLSQSGLEKFIITMILLFSVWTTFVDVLEELRGAEIFGLSTISRFGSGQGFNIVNFSLVYCIGGYLRYGKNPKFKRSTLLICWIMTVSGIFIWAVLVQGLTRLELRSAWVYHNPLVILSAVLLFLIFKGFHFSNIVINDLSAASFTCFLIHSVILSKIGIQKAVESNVVFMLLHIIISAVSIYLLSWVVYKVYTLVTKRIFNYLGRMEYFKAKEIT